VKPTGPRRPGRRGKSIGFSVRSLLFGGEGGNLRSYGFRLEIRKIAATFLRR